MIKKRKVEQLVGLGSDATTGVTARIRQLQNGVTRLIESSPDFKVQNSKVMAKAVAQSDTLIVVDLTAVEKKQQDNKIGEIIEKKE